jgi:hypothetical protein
MIIVKLISALIMVGPSSIILSPTARRMASEIISRAYTDAMTAAIYSHLISECTFPHLYTIYLPKLQQMYPKQRVE